VTLPSDRLAYITQTTLSIDDTIGIIEVLRRRFPEDPRPRKEDICYATTNRQAAVKVIAPRSDLLLVIGAPNSSNSQRLVEVARGAGCPSAYLVQRAAEIDWSWFEGREDRRHHRRRVGARGAGAGGRSPRSASTISPPSTRSRSPKRPPTSSCPAPSLPDDARLMAVYTEVPDNELRAFVEQYRDRRGDGLQGHRRGRREQQLPAAHHAGSYILTLYEKRVSARTCRSSSA
jgi:hypothetical protein